MPGGHLAQIRGICAASVIKGCAASPAGITYLHETCMRQRGVVPEMEELGRVYDGYCGGAVFNANRFSDLLRLYLIREEDCEVRNSFGEVVEVSAMCTRGPASQLCACLHEHRSAQVRPNW